VLVGIVAGSALTAAYGARFVWGAFATKQGHARRTAPRTPVDRPAAPSSCRRSSSPWRPSSSGLVPALADPLVVAAAEALDPGWRAST
jgi:multicomponent Na+:H+ antiporter subunit A